MIGPPPECCLVNLYRAGARMGLHQDRDEKDVSAAVIGVSLGDEALFRIGGQRQGRQDRQHHFWPRGTSSPLAAPPGLPITG